MPLTDEQVDRYSRQIILPEVGGTGQEKLLGARVRVSDRGSVGAWASRYLVAAGVGEVVIEPELGGELRAALADLNPDCRIDTEGGRLGGKRSPLVLLASAGDASIADGWRSGVPMVVARLRGAAGDLTVLESSLPSSACPGCAGVERPADEPGAAGALPHAAPFIAVLAVSEVLKLVLGVGRTLHGRRLTYDAKAQVVAEAPLDCRPGCTRRGR